MKILIVDDDTDLAEALIEQLSLYDEFELSHEDSASKGIKSARDGQVDLVVTEGVPSGFGASASAVRRCQRGRARPMTAAIARITRCETK